MYILCYVYIHIVLAVSVFILCNRYDLGFQNVSSIFVSQMPNESGYFASFVEEGVWAKLKLN